MQTVGNQFLTGTALADNQYRFVQRCEAETCSSTSRKLLASPNKLSLYSAMMNFATC
ncbi:Uncharacterised protein [Citrobacter amalonaticus]|nr:Uncharacterised protein [Citrobacter amalonaticus]